MEKHLQAISVLQWVITFLAMGEEEEEAFASSSAQSRGTRLNTVQIRRDPPDHVTFDPRRRLQRAASLHVLHRLLADRRRLHRVAHPRLEHAKAR